MGGAACIGPVTAVGAPPSTRRMTMSDSAMLAARAHSDSAVGQEAAGDAAGEKAVDRFRSWVGDHRESAALLAGLVATHLATVVGYFMPGIGLPQLDWNRINGAIYTPQASPDVQFLSGGVFHYVDGKIGRAHVCIPVTVKS